jgi:hypothetical protein
MKRRDFMSLLSVGGGRLATRSTSAAARDAVIALV